MMQWGIAPGAPFESILDSTARTNIWHGPVRSAKTTHSLIRWLEYIPEAPRNGELFMWGKTHDTLERNILKPLELATGGAFTYSKGNSTARWAGRDIALIGANDERSESRIRGVTAAGGYGDELTLTPEAFFRQFLARMSARGAKLFGTTNPDGPYHWLKTQFIDREGELDLRAFTWPIEANIFLDPAYIAALKAEYGEGTLWYKRFLLGLWVAAEGAVYDFFNEREHRLEAEPTLEPEHVDIAVDYGTANATAAGLFYSWSAPIVRDAGSGEWRRSRLELAPGLRAYLKRTYYHSGRETGRQKTDAEYARELITWAGRDLARVRFIIVDPSAASFKAELRQQLERLEKPPRARIVNADNERLDGIRNQARLLKGGMYKIGPDSTNDATVREYGGYMWDSKAQARGEDAPLKENDHTKDFERYYLLKTLPPRGLSSRALKRAQGFR